jgi:hypothetical protein
MGYKFCWQTSFGYFSPYFLLFVCGPKFLALIRQDLMDIINLINPNVWLQACEQRRVLFQCVMPMVMENLTIFQH